MRYSKLAQVYEALSKTSKRLEKTDILVDFLKELDDKEVLYLLLGDIYPEYDERKIGISEQIVIHAISQATGIEKDKVVHRWKILGDLGEVSEELTKNKKQATLSSRILTTEKVLENLRKLPELEGKGTISKKLSLITELLTSANPIEAKYLVRTLIGELRIGIKESTIREALAKVFFKDKEDAPKIVQDAIDKSNDISEVFEASKQGNLKALERIKLEIGKPVKAMLAQKARTIKEGFDAVGTPCAVEFKYDGFRMIIHKKGNKVILFTRRLENVTAQFPEVVDYVIKYVDGESFILDSEAVGFDSKTKKYSPFQSISQRIKRKYGIEEMQKNLPIELNIFDILYYNGKSMLEEPFEKRSKKIREIIHPHPYKIICSKQIITSNEKEAEEFYKLALKENQEGVMVKNLNAPYQPGSRVGHMLKIKPEEKDFDLAITGAEYGTGKRSGWMSSFILSCRSGNKFLEIGRMGTGIKEKEEEGVSFKELTEKLKPLIIKEHGKIAEIKPKIIVAVTYQEIQRSPNYNSGFALRFPRFTALRPDKPLSEVNSIEDIEKAYKEQKLNWKYG